MAWKRKVVMGQCHMFGNNGVLKTASLTTSTFSFYSQLFQCINFIANQNSRKRNMISNYAFTVIFSSIHK